MQPKFLACFLILLTVLPLKSEAAYLGLLIGPKSESYSELNNTERSRLNPASILVEVGAKLHNRVYLSGSLSGEFNLDELSSVGFSLHAFVRYYFIGYPDSIKGTGKGANLAFESPYTVFAGAGLFHKNIKFLNNDLGDIDENLGGLGILFGGSYDLSRSRFLIGQVQYLQSGSSGEQDYTSAELYLGLGLRF